MSSTLAQATALLEQLSPADVIGDGAECAELAFDAVAGRDVEVEDRSADDDVESR